MKTLLVLVAITIASTLAYADEKPKLGRDDFISTTVSDIFAKVGQYTSGEKKIFDSDWKNSGEGKGYGKGETEEDVIFVHKKSPAAAATEKGKEDASLKGKSDSSTQNP